MLTLDQVARLALALPDVTEGERHGNRAWSVSTKVFVWERPFSKADIKRFGDLPIPDGPVIAISVSDLGEKEGLLAANGPAFFTIAHFDGYPAVLVRLNLVAELAVADALIDGWLACAPAKLVREHVGSDGVPVGRPT